MKRNLRELSQTEFDLLIIGGGIYGSFIAWEASLRGFKAALIEKGDFGSATSANSLKIAHGGLRYLQHLDFSRMRQSIRARRALMDMAPHLVRPISCLMPAYGHGPKGREALALAVKISDLVGSDVNRDLPRSRALSVSEVLDHLPGLEKEGLSGGIEWSEGFIHNPERLTLSVVKSAVKSGASAANYLKALKVLVANGRVTGAHVEDQLNGESFDVRAKLVINAAGPWVKEVAPVKVGLTQAFNLIFDRQIVAHKAAGVFRPGGQVLFMVPWRGITVLGTCHKAYGGIPENGSHVSEVLIEQFLRSYNEAYPGFRMKRENIRHVNAGILPGESKEGEAILLRHFRIDDHEKTDNLPGLISVIGVKYTTARDVAERVLDHVAVKWDRPMGKSQTERSTVAGGDMENFGSFLKRQITAYEGRWSDKSVEYLAGHYGTEMNQVLSMGQPDAAGVPTAEILFAVREEMAIKLSDVVRRRTTLGGQGRMNKGLLQACAQVMAKEMGWNEDKTEKEINDCDLLWPYDPTLRKEEVLQ